MCTCSNVFLGRRSFVSLACLAVLGPNLKHMPAGTSLVYRMVDNKIDVAAFEHKVEALLKTCKQGPHTETVGQLYQ